MKNFTAQCVICLTIFLTAQTIINAAAVIDRSFGTNGTVTTTVGGNLVARAVKIQPDGKILVLGNLESFLNTMLARYNPDGSLDANFGTNGIVTVEISPYAEKSYDLAVQPDGKIVVAGNFYSTVTESIDFAVTRFNGNGSLDTAFGVNGTASVNQGSSDVFSAVAVQPDGKIVAAGHTSDGDRAAVIRFTASGVRDADFGDGGLVYFTLSPFSQSDQFSAIALYPNGRIIVGGTAWDSLAANMIVMLEPNGAPATDFGLNGVVANDSSYGSNGKMGFWILPDGKFLAIHHQSLRRLMPDGALDQSFQTLWTTGAAEPSGAGDDLVVRSDGKIIALNQSGFSRADTTAYNINGREISRAKSLGGIDIAIQSDDKFVILNATTDSIKLTRYNSISSAGTRIADFDFDGKTDLLVSRLGQNVYALRSRQNVISYQINRGSGEGVRFLPEDYTTNDPDRFPINYWRYAGQNNPAYFERVDEYGRISTRQWGMSGDMPVGGDYDGEALNESIPTFRRPSETAIFRPSTGDWWIFNGRTNVYWTYHWGAAGDKPVPADYDYDGVTDYAVYRPSTGTWWVHRSGDDSYFTIQFGNATDIPLTGDYDGDGRADFTVYRASEGNWYQYLTTEGFRVVRFGLAADYPVPGDYDGDGQHDIAVFREGVWYLLQSSDGFRAVQWGTATDSPIAVRYDQ